MSKMEQKQTSSCMKIGGVPILPPLITPDRRKELLEYKRKAVMLEELYQKRKQFSKDKTNVVPENNHPIYQDNELKYVYKAYIPYEIRQKDNPDIPIESFKNTEPSPKMIDNFNTDKFNLNKTFKNETISNSNFEISENDLQYPNNDSSRPRLIRSNSYTLDTPSTILLDHLRRQSASSCDPSISSTQNNMEIKSTERNVEEPKETFDNSTLKEQTGQNASHQPSLEVITTDITVQQINITTSDVTQINSNTISSSKNPEVELHEILKQIPENYAKKIVELMQAQKIEQLNKAQNNELNLFNSDNIELNYKNSQSPKRIISTGASNSQSNIRVATEDSDESRLENLDSQFSARQQSISSSLGSQTLCLDISTSSSDSLDNFSLKTFRVLDVDNKHNVDLNVNKNSSHNCILNIDEIERKEEIINSKQSVMQNLRKEKAASVIGAYVKGYLVRRLMRTIKVKTIIQTIQDALVCALELQNSEKVEEADVELHRKLIKLVSSACCEFHDIFFVLPVREKMDIIAKDREKLNKNAAVRTTRSSTEIRQPRRTSKIRYTKSLTMI